MITALNQYLSISNRPILISSGNNPRSALLIQNLGIGNIYISFGSPPNIAVGVGTYGGYLIVNGQSFMWDRNCPADQIFAVSDNPLSGSDIYICETYNLGGRKK